MDIEKKSEFKQPSTKISQAVAPKLKTETGAQVFSITIGRSLEEVYSFFRDFKNLPLFMKDLKSVDVISPTLSHWRVVLKSGLTVEWDAEIFEEVPGRSFSWRSQRESKLETAGSVWFEKAPGKLGTVVRLSMHYKIPGGKLAELATLFTGEDPKHLTLTNLRRFKALLETGEIPTIEGQPSGREELKPSDRSDLH